eukprot:CAMPEP_0167774814 /NCGR_PEP_ID=MMETSP0111_2-20121227/2207_1 /TAXON_ID=91324 /ORGANISM="Lotharella globosa, Strain CCCM811" /LENGTH=102 /DNA_ID=CAMNT_0007664649 /DNA_START=980 /DNA_END=1288 /DNA_ORIENTATION=-
MPACLYVLHGTVHGAKDICKCLGTHARYLQSVQMNGLDVLVRLQHLCQCYAPVQSHFRVGQVYVANVADLLWVFQHQVSEGEHVDVLEVPCGFEGHGWGLLP